MIEERPHDDITRVVHGIKKHKKLFFLLLSGFFFFCFFVFSIMVKKQLFTHFDFNMTVRFQDHTPLKLDPLYQAFSSLASIQGMSLLLIILLFFRKQVMRGILVLGMFFASHSVELYGKLFINHPPPPFMFYKHIDATSFGFDKYYVQSGNSYPSGHSFRTVFVAMLFVYTVWTAKRFSPTAKLVALFIAIGFICLVGISRISLGEHWTSDVIGGGLFGFATGFFSLLFL